MSQAGPVARLSELFIDLEILSYNKKQNRSGLPAAGTLERRKNQIKECDVCSKTFDTLFLEHYEDRVTHPRLQFAGHDGHRLLNLNIYCLVL